MDKRMVNDNGHLTIAQHLLCASPRYVLIPIPCPPEGGLGKVGEVPQLA